MKLQSCLLSSAILAAIAVSTPASAVEASIVDRARAHIDSVAAPSVYRAPHDDFIAVAATVDPSGGKHVRFKRTYRGLPVIGGDFVMHDRGDSVDVSISLASTKRPALKAAVSADEAIVEAGADFGTSFARKPVVRQVVYALGRAPVLAWEVVFEGVRRDQTPTEMHYFIDADSGAILRKWDAVHTATPGPGDTMDCGGTAATGTGHGLTVGTVPVATTDCGPRYQLKDPTRGGGMTTNMLNRQSGNGSLFVDADNTWGSGALSDMSTAAVEAHYGIAATWDYFKARHGRLGIADDGRGAISRVHYGRNYANAFWRDSCFCMTFGDGDNGVTMNPLTVLDVAAHEMSHGVTSTSAGLIYDGESGGLNEATSDIFGTMVEFYAANEDDRGDWLIGEEFIVGNPGDLAMRYMFKPSLDGASADCWSPNLGGMDVHYSSGVANHFFYLLSQGAVVPRGFRAGSEANLRPADLVCNGDTSLAGITKGKAAKIWYDALTNYMLPDTDYAGAREATLQAAADRYGDGSDEQLAVAAAWSAVGVE